MVFNKVGFIKWFVYCDVYFYGKILLGLFLVLLLVSFFKDNEKIVKADMISTLAITSISITFLSFIGTLIVDSYGTPMISNTIMIICLSLTLIFVSIWVLIKR